LAIALHVLRRILPARDRAESKAASPRDENKENVQ
jgi:hypothetical protein